MLNRIAGLLIITVSLLIAWFVMEFKQFANTPMKLSKEGVYYLLEPGTSLSGLARDLMDKGMVDSKLYFRLLARWQGSAAKIKAGEYHLQSGMTPNALLALLVSGSVTSYTLTLVEGWNFLQVLSAIRQQSALKQTLEGLSDDQVMQRLGHPDEHPEGRFLPDTYQFPRGTSDISFLNRAYKAMDQRLKKEWEKREKGVPLKTPYEALILASIVEKETGYPSERTQIAGVFTRRLRKEMKLQTDPTVIYGMGEAYDGNIRRRDLKRDTPYNTYVHKGLPPTPISMPGGDAIHAVMHPGKGKSLYFVAKSGGQHYFSNTLREHNNAVRKYQLKR
ncbi:endolytic transglycosylase MltG [Candidatus Vondammii sp. HM_W22]|uniref:endolytic transglycosylase MltG n=1 Tax=Candidatus Vondammii sp. HM_W22 TaxID=2687299 RepID=UPI001F134581|nr:endolytic transglycosylase MltG [Candidatus Vondammii sp. HM_W22]